VLLYESSLCLGQELKNAWTEQALILTCNSNKGWSTNASPNGRL